MAIISIEVPAEVCRMLSSIEVEGDKEDSREMHITVVYLGSGVPVDQVMASAAVLHEVLKDTAPFSCSVDHLEHFEPSKHSDGKYPVICPVTSPELHTLRSRLTQALTKAGVEFPNDFPDYKPHVTLAYSEEVPKGQKFQPLPWEVYELVLRGGDSGSDRISIRVPLQEGKLSTRIARRFLESGL